MNREIKFRAWAMHSKRMIDIKKPETLDRNENGFYCPAYDADGNIYHAELMQFTGLLDKNGVEIYEGDILKDLHDSESFTVEWSKGECAWSIGDKCFYDWVGGHDGYNPKGAIVIGNIHQHPDLLTV